MDRASMDKLVNDHFMYEATADLEGVISTYTDDPEHHVVGGPDGPLRGKAAIRGFYVGLFRDLKGERAEPVMRLYGDDFIIDETVLVGHVVDGRPFSLPGSKGPIRLRLLHVFQLRDGRIAKEKVWFDLGDVKRQLGMESKQGR
jgi:ketosteroid isomerase-like protein